MLLEAEARLPEILRPLFRNSDFDQLTWRDHRDYVVRRVLSAGTWDAVCWLRVRFSDGVLRQWIDQHHGRGLSSRQLRFWELILDLPRPLVDAWLQSEGRRIWEGRGRGRPSTLRSCRRSNRRFCAGLDALPPSAGSIWVAGPRSRRTWDTGSRRTWTGSPASVSKTPWPSLQDRGAKLRIGTVGRTALHGAVRGVRASFLEYLHPTLAPLVAGGEKGRKRYHERAGVSWKKMQNLGFGKLSSVRFLETPPLSWYPFHFQDVPAGDQEVAVWHSSFLSRLLILPPFTAPRAWEREA